jgi:hypothetical protein
MSKVMIGDFEVSNSSIDRFVSITALGRMYGVSSRLAGKWLVDCGLREEYVPTEGKACLVPTSRAHSGGYVKQAMAPNERFFHLWHLDRTIHALKDAGHVLPKRR